MCFHFLPNVSERWITFIQFFFKFIVEKDVMKKACDISRACIRML